MKKITYVSNASEVDYFNSYGMEDLVVSCLELSRFATNSLTELIEIINYKKQSKAELILEWDVLCPEKTFKSSVEILKKIPLHEFKSIRAQDPGAVEYVKENYPWLKIQLILETGNHNLIGLKKWESYLGDQLERIIVSNELSKEHLELYSRELKTPIEILVLGRILLFYSPRSLLNPLTKEEKEVIYASGKSEESPHSGFPLIENAHGTFMFNVKDLSLVEHFKELENMGIKCCRFDFRFDNFRDMLPEIKKSLEDNEYVFKPMGPRPFIKGFYNVNKTDILFSKLKNNRISRVDSNYLGEIIDVEKDTAICLLMKRDFQNFDSESIAIKLITPEGKVKKTHLNAMKNSLGNTVFTASNESIILLPYVRGVSVKTQVYLDEIT